MAYLATIFLSSFLLFLVQPLVARLILPWFGGSAAVWTTCMLFFQALLLAGYAYAHGAVGRLAPRTHAWLQLALLAAAVALLPIAPDEAWKPEGSESPVLHILLLLGAAVGLPYLLLAATSPLVQVWYARTHPGRDPYRLYAVSNLASLAALISYPLLVEPWLTNAEQVAAWSWLFAAFALSCATLAWRARHGGRGPAPGAEASHPETSAAPTRGEIAYWLAFSTTGSVLLLAVTNHLTQNVASIPLLWLAPLTLYLLSFVITFSGRALYRSGPWSPAVLVVLAAMAWLLADKRLQFELGVQLAVFLPGLFLACVFCHGELYARRPGARHLTMFYMVVSAGGALGGLLVAVGAPLAFNGYHELGVGLVALGVLAARRYASLGRLARLASLATVMAVAGCATYDALRHHQDVRVAARGFYGVLRVKAYGSSGEEGELRRLLHGAIMHGEQYVGGTLRAMTTTYYQSSSGIGAALLSKSGQAVHVGVIGLGVGTLAAYGHEGDRYRFYDIDPRVIEFARTQFTYLADSAAKIELVLGDARLALERETPRHFDVLAVDAFSGDAIPVHLITREALATYLRHVKPEGIVAFHLSNRFLDLVPVVARLARENGAQAVLVRDVPAAGSRGARSDWVLVSRDPAALAHEDLRQAGAVAAKDRAELRSWTDDYSNLVQILKSRSGAEDD